MKQKCSFILKASIAMILALIMLFGTVATSIAAVVEDDYADTGANVDIADEAADVDVAEVAADVDVVDEGSDVDLADTAATGDWYIVGNVAGANNWSERDAVKFSAVTGGYSITIQLENNKDFRLRHNSSDYGAASSSNSDRKVSDSTTNHSLAAGNQTFIWTGDTGTYTVAINSDGSKISFDGSVPGAGGGGGGGSGGLTTASKGNIPARVLAGTDIMFYICGYSGTNGLTNSSKQQPTSTASSKDDLTADKVFYSKAQVTNHSGDAYVQITKSLLSTSGTGKFYRISNNLGGWEGNENANLKDLTVGGGNYWANDNTGHGDATSCTTTISNSSSVVQGETVDFKTTCGSTNLAYDKDDDLYYQYYIDSSTTPVAVDTSKDAIKGSTSEQTFTLPSSVTSSLSAGTHTITTVVTNGHIWYISETDTLTVLAPETKHAVTISASPVAGGTITPASGTEVGESTAQTITATPSAGYQFSSWTFGSGITYSSTTTNPATITTKSSGNYTVQANFTAKPLHTITVKSSNNVYGTATSSVAEAYEGQSVTITATENTGTFSKWKVTSGTVSGVDNDSNKTKTFDMGSTDLVITANFAAYSGTSNFYYNSYGSNGQPAATHYGALMTEAKLNGETYSYYHVTGRNEADQLFTVSYGSPKYNSYNTYFEIWSDWESGGVQAQFYTTDGKNLGDYTGMTYDTEANQKKKFKIAIPDGASSVQFKHGGSTTGILSMTSGCNAWYTNNKNGNLTDVTGYNSSNPVPVNFYENFNGTNKYTDAFNSGGFYNHGANRGEQHQYSKPKEMDQTQRGDYYILVLYENKTYTINGVTKTITNNPEIIWLPTLPDETTDLARIYAKDGCINADRNSTRVIGTTNITASDTVKNVSRAQISGITDYATARAEKGKSITITTEINSTYASKYYVKGWDVNGTTYGLDSTPTGNTYSATFTVPDADKVEITPIYWLKAGYDTTTFFVKDFNKVPAAWGTALYYYYWCASGSQVDVDNEERYPGQPFVHEGGTYYAQVPTDVIGVTLNNAVWDTIHGEMMMGKSGDSAKQAAHYQTYDYDNFAKIIKEKTHINSIFFTFKYESKKDNFGSSHGGSSITVSSFNDTNGNGWEDYKDTLGRPNNILGGTDVSGSGILYAVSNGYVRNYQGNYATEWSIYYASSAGASTANKVAELPGSALVLDAAADFSKSDYNGDYNPKLSTYQSEWNTLKSTYSTVPVKISYEQGIYGDLSRVNTGETAPGSSNSDPATRIDGKWDYTRTDDYVTADIKIQYSNDNGATYTYDTFSSDASNVGPITQAQAYFNNTGEGYQNKHIVALSDEVPISNSDSFVLKTVPKASTGYQFVGWYRLDDGSEKPELISPATVAESLMSSKATFIARYKLVTIGNLVIAHDADGAGSAAMHTVKAEIYNGDVLVNTLEGESVSLDDTYITSNSTFKIKVTLTAKSETNSYIANSSATPTVACSAAAETFYKNPAYTRNVRYADSTYPVDVVTTVDTFDVSALYSGSTQSIKVLTYTTTFNKLPTYTINYRYHGRQSTGESDYLTFTRVITLTPDEAEGKNADGTSYTGNEGQALTATYKTTSSDGLVNDITANAPNRNDLQTEVFNKEIEWETPDSIGPNYTTVTAIENAPKYTLTYWYVGNDGIPKPASVQAEYNKLITLGEKIGETDTFATAETYRGEKFAYWALGNVTGDPLTSTREYKMRLVNDVTIYPVYGTRQSAWTAAIDKITRTHQTSDDSDSIFTDFALRFTGFDDNGSFIHINPDNKNKYKVGVAVVYDTEGNNITATTEQLPDGSNPFTSLTKYTDAQNVIQTLVNRNLSTAKLSQISATTFVSKYDADNNKLTNFNRIDYALKYNYNTYYKRSYDAYAYIIDTTDTTGGDNGTVIAVSPVKSGYLYDGKRPSGAGN